MLSMSLWSVNYAFEIGFMDIEVKYFFARLEYLGIAFAPVAWFLFAAEYSGICRQFVRKYEKAIFLFPCLAILLMLTNSIHGLYFEGLFLISQENFLSSCSTWTIFLDFLYLLLCFANAWNLFLLQAVYPPYRTLRDPGSHCSYCSLYSSAWKYHFISHDIGPFEFLDPTPFSFTITGLILFWGTIQHEFLNIIPVARESVIESMNDGYIVVDLTNSIVDINKAALELAGKVRKEVGEKFKWSFRGGSRDFR